jgi:hypothetical protein
MISDLGIWISDLCSPQRRKERRGTFLRSGFLRGKTRTNNPLKYNQRLNRKNYTEYRFARKDEPFSFPPSQRKTKNNYSLRTLRLCGE